MRLAAPEANIPDEIPFREFVAVAREFLNERPEQGAIYLAALVALDMGAPDGGAPRAVACPSRN